MSVLLLYNKDYVLFTLPLNASDELTNQCPQHPSGIPNSKRLAMSWDPKTMNKYPTQ